MIKRNKSIIYLVACFLSIGLSLSCTDSDVSQIYALGSKFQITLYSGGVAVKTWKSTGKVSTEAQSDGWFFRDAETDRLVRVSGTVTVEELAP